MRWRTNSAKGDVGTVVVTLGTTAVGAVDSSARNICDYANVTGSGCTWMRRMAGISS